MNDYTITYRDWTIVVDHERREFMAFPTSQGVQHDGDLVGESYQYCGNCLWNSDENGLRSDIDDAIIMEQERTIAQLKEALMFSTAALIAAKSTLDLINVSTEVLPERIQKNEQLLKNLES